MTRPTGSSSRIPARVSNVRNDVDPDPSPIRGASPADAAKAAWTSAAVVAARACLASRSAISDGQRRLAKGSTGLTTSLLADRTRPGLLVPSCGATTIVVPNACGGAGLDAELVDAHRHWRHPADRATGTAALVLGAQQSGGGQEAGVADHAVVGPDRAVLDVPGPVQHLEGARHTEGALLEHPAELGG